MWFERSYSKWSFLFLILTQSLWGAPVEEIQVPKFNTLIDSKMSDFKIVNFWASWCEPCRDEFPELLKLKRDAAMKEIPLYLISTDSKSEWLEAEKFLKDQGVDFLSYRIAGSAQTFMDGVNARGIAEGAPDRIRRRAWQGALPTTYIFDREGKVLERFDREVTAKELKRFIEGQKAEIKVLAPTISPSRVLVSDTLALGDSWLEVDTPMQATSGETITLRKVKGKQGLMVVFSSNACPYAKKWRSRMVRLGNDYRKKGIGWIVINSNDPERSPEDGLKEMRAIASGKTDESKEPWAFPYAVDSTSNLARAFGATKTPEFFLFNAKGQLVYHGALDADADDTSLQDYSGNSRTEIREKQFLKNAMDQMLAGKKIERPRSDAFGCGIKFRKP